MPRYIHTDWLDLDPSEGRPSREDYEPTPAELRAAHQGTLPYGAGDVDADGFVLSPNRDQVPADADDLPF